ncbi:MAG: hypothetical protein ACON4N_03115 [Myxococcota bacterium]
MVNQPVTLRERLGNLRFPAGRGLKVGLVLLGVGGLGQVFVGLASTNLSSAGLFRSYMSAAVHGQSAYIAELTSEEHVESIAGELGQHFWEHTQNIAVEARARGGQIVREKHLAALRLATEVEDTWRNSEAYNAQAWGQRQDFMEEKWRAALEENNDLTPFVTAWNVNGYGTISVTTKWSALTDYYRDEFYVNWSTRNAISKDLNGSALLKNETVEAIVQSVAMRPKDEGIDSGIPAELGELGWPETARLHSDVVGSLSYSAVRPLERGTFVVAQGQRLVGLAYSWFYGNNGNIEDKTSTTTPASGMLFHPGVVEVSGTAKGGQMELVMKLTEDGWTVGFVSDLQANTFGIYQGMVADKALWTRGEES